MVAKYNRGTRDADYYRLNRDSILADKRAYYKRNRSWLKPAIAAANKHRYWNNAEWRLAQSIRGRASRMLRKAALIRLYGGKCTCCGERRLGFLTVEHIKGGGSLVRKLVGRNKHTAWLLAKEATRYRCIMF